MHLGSIRVVFYDSDTNTLSYRPECNEVHKSNVR